MCGNKIYGSLGSVIIPAYILQASVGIDMVYDDRIFLFSCLQCIRHTDMDNAPTKGGNGTLTCFYRQIINRSVPENGLTFCR
ncbi:hypothetical protein D3C78_1605850 [compost metagenome]